MIEVDVECFDWFDDFGEVWEFFDYDGGCVYYGYE